PAQYAQASVAGVIGKQRSLDRIDVAIEGRSHPDRREASRRAAEIERGKGDKHARAVAGKPLRLDDRPGGGSRRNVYVSGVLVLQRLGNEKWRISAIFGLDVPTRQVAADAGHAVAYDPRGYHQDDADDGVGALEQIAKSWQTRWYVAFGEAAQPEELE